MTKYVRVHINLPPENAGAIADYIYEMSQGVSEFDPQNSNILMLLSDQIQRALERLEEVEETSIEEGEGVTTM